MKRIVIYINSMVPPGGIERVVSTFIAKMQRLCIISLVVKDEGDSFYHLPDDINIYKLECPLTLNMNNRLLRIYQFALNSIKAVKNLKSKLIEMDYDYIYVTTPLNYLELVCAGVPANKIIITEHGAQSHYNLIYRIIKKVSYKYAYQYIVPTSTDANIYRSQKLPVSMIPHFKSPLQYLTSENVQQKIVLNIGRYTPDKQQLVLLQCWKQLMLIHPELLDWQLRIVGGGELHSTLLDFITNENLINVYLVPATQEIAQEYAKAAVFALTSKSEGYGMVLLEAVTFGLPCIAFDCPVGPRDILCDSENGFLIPLNNNKLFIEKLYELLTDDQLRDQFKIHAKKHSANWDDEVIQQKWLQIIR